MVGRTRKSDVKSRLGNKRFAGTKPIKSGNIRDARDILRKKVPTKGRLTRQTANTDSKDRIRRLMPLGDLLSGSKKKTIDVTYDDSSKDKLRTLSLSSGSLRVTTKQPELCRKTVVSRNSLKVVTPSKTIPGRERSPAPAPATSTTRTLTNDLYTRQRSPLVSAMDAMDKDLRTSSPNLSFTTEYKPMLYRSPLSTQRQDTDQKILTKIVVTNLHPRVVQEDIAELFSAVGPLTNVKLEHCVAEVNFAKAVNADMAYKKYHNRMLDGQAMKCTLGLANTPAQTSTASERMNYTGADLVYPQTPSRPVVFQVRI